MGCVSVDTRHDNSQGLNLIWMWGALCRLVIASQEVVSVDQNHVGGAVIIYVSYWNYFIFLATTLVYWNRSSHCWKMLLSRIRSINVISKLLSFVVGAQTIKLLLMSGLSVVNYHLILISLIIDHLPLPHYSLPVSFLSLSTSSTLPKKRHYYSKCVHTAFKLNWRFCLGPGGRCPCIIKAKSYRGLSIISHRSNAAYRNEWLVPSFNLINNLF